MTDRAEGGPADRVPSTDAPLPGKYGYSEGWKDATDAMRPMMAGVAEGLETLNASRIIIDDLLAHHDRLIRDWAGHHGVTSCDCNIVQRARSLRLHIDSVIEAAGTPGTRRSRPQGSPDVQR